MPTFSTVCFRFYLPCQLFSATYIIEIYSSTYCKLLSNKPAFSYSTQFPTFKKTYRQSHWSCHDSLFSFFVAVSSCEVFYFNFNVT